MRDQSITETVDRTVVVADMFRCSRKQCQLADAKPLVFETGIIARQADGAVILRSGNAVVLATTTFQKLVKPGQNFLPLTVDYVEKSYAAGKIPGGYFKREGRSAENEILISRLIDRPLRPLFPKNFFNDIHVVVQVFSMDEEIPTDILAINAASASVALSGLPLKHKMAAVRVGYINKQYVINPTRQEQKSSHLDLVMAATVDSVLMVEAAAQELPEDIILGAMEFGHRYVADIIESINGLSDLAGKPVIATPLHVENTRILHYIGCIAKPALRGAYQIQDKQARSVALKEIYLNTYEQMKQALSTSSNNEANVAYKADEENEKLLLSCTDSINDFDEEFVCSILRNFESDIVRSQIIAGESRIDGRGTDDVRQISILHNLAPSAHGSVLFTRGETQALVTVTLGTPKDEQVIDALEGEYRDRFMFHYNMPPFATGETGRFGSPKRREIGHGRLAKRALEAVLPDPDSFPYSIRLVSEILESNGSSSMASVCGGSLALMEAGIKLRSHVAGIAMGLILEGNRYAVLTDILGDEDQLGDMDFKVAGTRVGITALQMDLKIAGIPFEVMKSALQQARNGRYHILDVMEKSISSVEFSMPHNAPKIETIKIPVEKIRDLIGKGGSVIRSLQEETKTKIDISDDGLVTICSKDHESIAILKDKIQMICKEPIVGEIYMGTVTKILEIGAIVNIFPGKDGLLHISEISHERIKDVKEKLSIGQRVRCKILHVENGGRFKLSLKALEGIGAK